MCVTVHLQWFSNFHPLDWDLTTNGYYLLLLTCVQNLTLSRFLSVSPLSVRYETFTALFLFFLLAILFEPLRRLSVLSFRPPASVISLPSSSLLSLFSFRFSVLANVLNSDNTVFEGVDSRRWISFKPENMWALYFIVLNLILSI